MYAEIKALHDILENENITHVFEKKYCKEIDLHSAVIHFQEEIDFFNGYKLKHNLPVWFMQIEGGKLYIYNDGSSLEMEVTPAQGLTLTNYFKEIGVI